MNLAMINFYFLKNFLAYRAQSNQVKFGTKKGFTLIELLVTVIIGGLVVSFATGIMVDILRVNQEERARTATQKDMKRTLDYIKRDLKEASFIYTGEQIRNQRGTGSNQVDPFREELDVNNNYTIALAFWKPETIPYTPGGADVPPAEDCDSDNISSETTTDECQALTTERRTYTLVVYLQQEIIDSDSTWSGKSVIRRYELRKYDNGDTYNSGKYLSLNVKDGYVDPRKEADGFDRWPYNRQGESLQDNKPKVDGNSSKVLVDFVGSPDPNSDSFDYNDVPTANIPNCNEGYSRTPADSKSFFACVKKRDLEGEFAQGNQDIFLYLRGNPDGRFGYKIRAGRLESYTPLPILESGVLVRGVVDKFLNN